MGGVVQIHVAGHHVRDDGVRISVNDMRYWPRSFLPGLDIPSIMHEMNYGCGSPVHLRDMRAGQAVLYVGVGGGIGIAETVSHQFKLQDGGFTEKFESVIF